MFRFQRLKTIFAGFLIFPLLVMACSGLNIPSEQPEVTEEESPALPTVRPTVEAGEKAVEQNALETIQDRFAAVYDQVGPSVVNIQVVKNLAASGMLESEGGQRPATGSGFVWDQQGHIVTNNHVVRRASQIRVTLSDGTSLSGEVVGTDRDSDLAVVRVDAPRDLLQPVAVADSTLVKVGQLVAAIGNPFGLQGSLTIGVVSALGRSIPVQDSALQPANYTIPDVIQTDAPINPGNSGGVLVDMNGRLIGVPTAIRSSSGVNAGIGFVVPSIIVEKVVPALIEKGEYQHPWIGIHGTTLQSEIAEAMGLSREQRGVLIAEVSPDSPAEEAGLQGSNEMAEINGVKTRIGGDLIVRIEDQKVEDFEDLTAYLARYTRVGQIIELTILRDQERMIVELTLEPRPEQEQLAAQQQRPAEELAWLGIPGLTLLPEIKQALDFSEGVQGLMVQQVKDGSPADQAGLQGGDQKISIEGEEILIGGDIITTVGKQPVKGAVDLQLILRTLSPGEQVEMTFIRDGEQKKLTVTLGEVP